MTQQRVKFWFHNINLVMLYYKLKQKTLICPVYLIDEDADYYHGHHECSTHHRSDQGD